MGIKLKSLIICFLVHVFALVISILICSNITLNQIIEPGLLVSISENLNSSSISYYPDLGEGDIFPIDSIFMDIDFNCLSDSGLFDVQLSVTSEKDVKIFKICEHISNISGTYLNYVQIYGTYLKMCENVLNMCENKRKM